MLMIVICGFLMNYFLYDTNPVVPVMATGGIDGIGNLLAVQQSDDDPSGVGDIFVFKRSSLDATGFFCRYDAGRGEYQWAPEYTMVERNRIWVQWITFELEYTPIHLQVRLIKETTDENDTILREITWVEEKSALLVKGYLYFNLPTSRTEQWLEIQRFSINEDEEIRWDSMVFILKHKTLASIIPAVLMPTDIFMTNLLSIVLTVTCAGAGGFWRGKKILEKSIYPPDRHAWLPYLVPVALIMVAFTSELILNIMMQSIIAFVLVYVVLFYVIFLGFDYLTTRIFREKPPLIAIQQIIVDSDEEYFALPTIALHIYFFHDSEGNKQEGFIPAGKLEDGDEFKQRMKGHHRQIIPILYRKEMEEITLTEGESEDSTVIQEVLSEETQWGLIAEDPKGTYKEIRIALEVKEPYRIEKKERIPIMEKQTTIMGVEMNVVRRNEDGEAIYKEITKVYEQRNLQVIAAPLFFQSTYEALRDVEKYKELADELHIQRDAYRNLERQMQDMVDKAVTEEVKLISDWGTLAALDPSMKQELTDFQNQILDLLSKSQTAIGEN